MTRVMDGGRGPRNPRHMQDRPSFDPRLPVRFLLERYPVARSVLASYGIDACCGGEHSLEHACAAKGISLAEVVADLVGTTIETAIRVTSRWQKEGVVETEKQGFRIRDPRALASMAPEE